MDWRLRLCLLVTLIWGLAAHAYGFLNGNFSHDALNAFYLTEAEIRWKIELGRYFAPVYHLILRGRVILPWLVGLVSILWVGLAVYFAVRLLDVKSKPVMVLISGIMITNITVTAQVATYIHELDCNSFALMLAVLAVWVWRRWRNLPAFALGAVLLMGSMGTYQAFFSTAVTLMVFRLILDLTEDREIKTVFLDGVRAVGMLLCGAVLYFIVGRYIYRMTGLAPQSRTDLFTRSGVGSFLAAWTGLLKGTYLNAYGFLKHAAYSGTVQMLNVLVVGIDVVLVAWLTARTKNRRIARVAMACVLMLLMPFAMNLTYFLAKGKGVHDLMAYSIWLVHVFALILLSRVGKPGELGRDVCLGAGCLMVALVLWQNVQLSNTAYIKKDMEARSTLSNMTRVVAQMEQREDYAFGETPVAFVGAFNIYGNTPEYTSVEPIMGLGESGAIPTDFTSYYYNAYKTYFDYVLNYPMVFCEEEMRDSLAQTQQVQDMPAFPDKGYMQMIDGVLVVKMG